MPSCLPSSIAFEEVAAVATIGKPVDSLLSTKLLGQATDDPYSLLLLVGRQAINAIIDRKESKQRAIINDLEDEDVVMNVSTFNVIVLKPNLGMDHQIHLLFLQTQVETQAREDFIIIVVVVKYTKILVH